VLNGRWSAYPILIAGNALLRCSSNTRARFPEALQIHQLFDLSLSSAGLVGSFAATSNVRGVRTDRIAHFCRFIQSGEADLCGVGAKEGKRTRVRVSEVAQELERAQERERERAAGEQALYSSEQLFTIISVVDAPCAKRKGGYSRDRGLEDRRSRIEDRAFLFSGVKLAYSWLRNRQNAQPAARLAAQLAAQLGTPSSSVRGGQDLRSVL